MPAKEQKHFPSRVPLLKYFKLLEPAEVWLKVYFLAVFVLAVSTENLTNCRPGYSRTRVAGGPQVETSLNMANSHFPPYSGCIWSIFFLSY